MFKFHTEFNPDTVGAGLICQVVADTESYCGYPDCIASVVGAVVHETRPGKGSTIVPVCERHKGWEFAKVRMDAGDTIYL